MARKGWHQTAVDKAKESLATQVADRAAMQTIVQGHLEQQMVVVPPITTS